MLAGASFAPAVFSRRKADSLAQRLREPGPGCSQQHSTLCLRRFLCWSLCLLQTGLLLRCSTRVGGCASAPAVRAPLTYAAA